MLYCDPPYGIGLDYRHGIGKTRDYGAQKTDDGKSPEEYLEFLTAAMSNGVAVVSENAHVFCWCDPNGIGTVQSVLA